MTVLTGVLNDSGGNPITGSLWLELSQPGIYNPGAILVTPLQPSTFQLTAGQITGPGPGPYQVYGNDGITPSSTWYALTAFDSSGQQVLRVNVRIEGASVDFGALTIAPTQNWTPPVDPSLTLGGDGLGPLGAMVVVGIRGRAVAAPPWTPGEILTVQGDGSLAFDANGAQPFDATLTALAGLATAADRLPYFTGPDAAALTPLSAFMRTLLDDGDQATALSTLGAAAASHSHTGLLSGLTSGYFPRASGVAALLNSPLYTDGMNLGLNQTTPTDLLHATRTAPGGRAALFLESLVANGYAAVKLGSLPTLSEFLVSSGYVGGVAAPGFSIRDTNAGEDRLTIDNSTGLVDLPFGARGPLYDDGGAVYNGRAHGLVGDGALDETAALQAFIDARVSGETMEIPPGRYKISDTIVFGNGSTSGASTVNYLNFRGAGQGVDVGNLNPGYGGATTFEWAGPAGIPMFEIRGPITINMSGFDLLGYTGGNVCGHGIVVYGAMMSTFERITVRRHGGKGIFLDCYATRPTGAANNPANNLFRQVYCFFGQGTSYGGLAIDSAYVGGGVGYDYVQTTFIGCKFTGSANDAAVTLGYVDNAAFFECIASNSAGGPGLKIYPADTHPLFPLSVGFYNCHIGGGTGGIGIIVVDESRETWTNVTNGIGFYPWVTSDSGPFPLPTDRRFGGVGDDGSFFGRDVNFKSSRIVSTGAEPTIVAGSGAGTGPTITKWECTDTAGLIQLVTGSAPSAAAIVMTLTYTRAFPARSHVVLFPRSRTAAEIAGDGKVFAEGYHDKFVLYSCTTPLAASTTYWWTYQVIGS